MAPYKSIYHSDKYNIDQWSHDITLSRFNDEYHYYRTICDLTLDMAHRLKSDADIEKYLILL